MYLSGAHDSARFGGGYAGIGLKIFHLEWQPGAAADRYTVQLSRLLVRGVRGADACSTAAARVADAMPSPCAAEAVDALIAAELTVIFAPKEWQSTGPATLAEFVALAPPPHRLVVVIAPPLSDTTACQLRQVAASAWPGSQTDVRVVEEPLSYRNAYELRNELAQVFAADSKFVLHLNNDVVSCACQDSRDRGWLRALVHHAEQHPEAWAVMPILLERIPTEPLHLHAWWASVARVPASINAVGDGTVAASGSRDSRPKLDARLDSVACSMPAAALPEYLAGRQPLFLEDHCILARVDRFPPSSPLFDPASCFRREFFDLAWSIRSRGGEVALAPTSVVIYDRLMFAPELARVASPSKAVAVMPVAASVAPTGIAPAEASLAPAAVTVSLLHRGPSSFSPQDDLLNFVARRHDEISTSSVRHLNSKWQVYYRSDDWHEAQRDHTLSSLRAMRVTQPDCPGLFELLSQRISLVLALLALAGYNRFQIETSDERSSQSSPPLDVIGALRTLTQVSEQEPTPLIVHFWRDCVQADVALIAGDGCEGGAHPLQNVVPCVARSLQADEACATPSATSADCLLHLHQIPPHTMAWCEQCAAMTCRSQAWFWVRLENEAIDRSYAEALAVELAQRLDCELHTAQSIDLTSDIRTWSYRPLQLREFEEFISTLSFGGACGSAAHATAVPHGQQPVSSVGKKFRYTMAMRRASTYASLHVPGLTLWRQPRTQRSRTAVE